MDINEVIDDIKRKSLEDPTPKKYRIHEYIKWIMAISNVPSLNQRVRDTVHGTLVSVCDHRRIDIMPVVPAAMADASAALLNGVADQSGAIKQEITALMMLEEFFGAIVADDID
jgi:hypothetical protein